MSLLYVAAAVTAVALAALLQARVAMRPPYAWLSRAAAAVFGGLAAPALLRDPDVESVSQLVLLVCLPLIAVPYQLRVLQLVDRGRRPGTAPRTGPGGGRRRPRSRRPRR